MIAVMHISPPVAGVPTRLQRIATFLRDVNVDWLNEQLAHGQTPPSSTLTAGAPWTAGVSYVAHHGEPLDELRHYFDGPTMFARRVGTCIDIAAYDAAALTVLRRKPTDVVVLPLDGDGRRMHAWIGRPGAPRVELVDPTLSLRKAGS